MGARDGRYSFEDFMLSMRLFTPLLLLLCTTTVGYLTLQIQENTKAVRVLEKTVSSMQSDVNSIRERTARLEGIFDEEFLRLRRID
jgi:hypothetical protein